MKRINLVNKICFPFGNYFLQNSLNVFLVLLFTTNVIHSETILDNPNCSVTITSTNTSCNVDNGLLAATTSGGSTPYSYLWCTGETTSVISNLAVGAYYITVMDGLGCKVTESGYVSNDKGPESLWQRKFGLGKANEIQQTTDGGYIVVGTTGDHNSSVTKCWVLKLDSLGNLEWEKKLGGTNHNEGRTVHQTQDGGYIVAGHYDYGVVWNNHDFYFIKLNKYGNEQWSQIYSGSISLLSSEIESIQQTSDGGYIATGYSYDYTYQSVAEVIKLNQSGNIVWHKFFGSGSAGALAYGHSIKQTQGGNYILAASHVSDFWILNLDGAGNIIWQKTFDVSSGVQDEIPHAIQQTTDGGFIIAGESGGDGLIIKLDNLGNAEWQKVISGKEAKSVYQIQGGGYVVAGTEVFSSTEQDVWFAELDHLGNLNSEGRIGEQGKNEANSVIQAKDGSYTIAGYIKTVIDPWTVNNQFSVVNLGSGMVEVDTVVHISCNNTYGSIALLTDCGVAPYSFLWSNGSTQKDATGLVVGDYFVTVTDSNGKTSYRGPITVEYRVNTTTILNYNINHISCNGSDGSIGLTLTNGGLPYTYLWSNGATTLDISNLSAGDYNLTVTDNSGCPVTFTKSIVFPTKPEVEWERFYGGPGKETINSVNQTLDNGFIFGGHEGYSSWVSRDCLVMKSDSLGNLEWEKSIGGSHADEANSIQQTQDGGFIVAGVSYSNDGDVTGNHGWVDFWVVKLDNAGNITWQKSLGGSDYEVAYSVQQTTDGGFIVAGGSESTNGDVSVSYGLTDYWVVKLNSTGIIEWEKSFGGSGIDEAYSVQQTSDGGFVVAGKSNSTDGDVTVNYGFTDYWVIKLNSTGSLEWQKSLGGSNADDARSIQQTIDGGYIIAGSSGSTDGDVTGNHGSYDYWVVKLDASGGLVWQKSLGGSSEEEAKSIQQTIDGGYIIAGNSRSSNGDVSAPNQGATDYWLVKIDSMGHLIWQKSFGGSYWDLAGSAIETSNSGIVIAGTSNSFSSSSSDDAGWVIKLGPVISLGTINSVNHVSCSGNSDGSIDISPGCGVAPYSFVWSNGSTQEDATGLTGGDYYLTISDANGETSELGPITVNSTQNTTPTATGATSICAGKETQLTGTTTTTGTTISYVWYIAGTSTIVSTDQNPLVAPVIDTDYELVVMVDGCASPRSSIVSVDVDPANAVCFTSKVFLQGPFVLTDMADNLKEEGYLPTLEPYTGLGFQALSNAGITVPTTEFTGATTNTDIVDWIVVQLRDKNDLTTVVSSTVMLLQQNGEIVSYDAGRKSTVLSFDVAHDDYYLAIFHRNHLPVMTDIPISFTGVSSGFDFTSTGMATYGIGSRIELATGVWGLVTGDSDNNNAINATDRSTVWNQRNYTGYLLSDVTMNGLVTAADRSVIWNNRNRVGVIAK